MEPTASLPRFFELTVDWAEESELEHANTETLHKKYKFTVWRLAAIASLSFNAMIMHSAWSRVGRSPDQMFSLYHVTGLQDGTDVHRNFKVGVSLGLTKFAL